MKQTALLAAVLTVSFVAGGYAVVGGFVESPEGAHRPITRGDLESSSAGNVYDAVNDLRGGWIHEPAEHGTDAPTVYIELRCKDVTCLRWIESGQVERVEYLARDSSSEGRSRVHHRAAIIVAMRNRATGLNSDSTGR